MRAKILILGLILLILIACKKGIENPYSPVVPDEPIMVGIKSFTFRVSVDFTGIPILPPSQDYPFWKVKIEGYFIGTILIETVGIEDRECLASPSMGVWQVRSNMTHEINAVYHSAQGLYPNNVPLEWQESIRWRFQVVDVKLDNAQFKMRIFVDGNETADTDWFDGWKAWVGTTEGSKKRILFTFRIESKY